MDSRRIWLLGFLVSIPSRFSLSSSLLLVPPSFSLLFIPRIFFFLSLCCWSSFLVIDSICSSLCVIPFCSIFFPNSSFLFVQGPHDVRVAMKAVGICGSDVHYLKVHPLHISSTVYAFQFSFIGVQVFIFCNLTSCAGLKELVMDEFFVFWYFLMSHKFPMSCPLSDLEMCRFCSEGADGDWPWMCRHHRGGWKWS